MGPFFDSCRKKITTDAGSTLKPDGGQFAARCAKRTTMSDLTVLFDGGCNLCRGSAERVKLFDTARRIEFLDLHDPSAQQRFPQLDREEAMRWMLAIDSNGSVFSGSDAWARIGGLLPGWKFLAWILLVPGIRWVAGKFYAWIAGNRYRWNRAVCQDGTCKVHLEKKSSSRL